VGLKGKTQVELDKLKSWRELDEFQKYSGTASYHIAFEVNSEMLRADLLIELDLGRVYEVAEVWLNDKRIGVSWFRPYRIDITGHLKKGTNKLRIDVANILKNHLTEGEYSHPSGLLGPVKIQGAPKILLNK
jgi:beta-galactosidase/beta-glucuronidase